MGWVPRMGPDGYHCKNNTMEIGMDRDQLIDLTRRALKLAQDKTTDLAPSAPMTTRRPNVLPTTGQC